MTTQVAVSSDPGGHYRLSEDDFDILYDSLDYYIDKYIQTVYLIEGARVAADMLKNTQGAEVSDADASRAASKALEDGKIKGQIRNIKEKVAILKAKLVFLKEKEGKSDLSKQIDQLLGEA